MSHRNGYTSKGQVSADNALFLQQVARGASVVAMNSNAAFGLGVDKGLVTQQRRIDTLAFD